MNQPRLNRRRSQFTTRGIFVATFWVAVFCFSLVFWRRFEVSAFDPGGSTSLKVLVCLAGVLIFVSIPVAICGLFRRALWGAAVGMVLLALYIGWISYQINTNFQQYPIRWVPSQNLRP